MTTSSPADKRPPSRRIADELRAAIERGDLAEGHKLPSERELARHYATARNTAREAIGILQAEGLVVAEHGRGVFVRIRRPVMRFGATGELVLRRRRACPGRRHVHSNRHR